MRGKSTGGYGRVQKGTGLFVTRSVSIGCRITDTCAGNGNGEQVTQTIALFVGPGLPDDQQSGKKFIRIAGSSADAGPLAPRLRFGIRLRSGHSGVDFFRLPFRRSPVFILISGAFLAIAQSPIHVDPRTDSRQSGSRCRRAAGGFEDYRRCQGPYQRAPAFLRALPLAALFSYLIDVILWRG